MAQKINNDKDTNTQNEVSVEVKVKDYIELLQKLDSTYVSNNSIELKEMKEAATRLRSLFGLATPEPVLVFIQILQNQKLQNTMEKILECLQEKK